MKHDSERYIPVNDQQIELLAGYGAAEAALAQQGPRIRQATDVISALSHEPSDEFWLPAAAEAVTSEDSPATATIDVLPLIQRAAEPFEPRQTDPSRPRADRGSKDWAAVSAAVKARLNAVPELGGRLEGWFKTTGRTMIATTYPTQSAENPFVLTIGGRNHQCLYRNVLSLVTLATPDFRASHGLTARQGNITLNGEETREKGWLNDSALLVELREHVAERVRAGEIAPRILVGGSGERVLQDAERHTVEKYITAGMEPLYPDRGLTEADAMLGGALRVFGQEDDTPLVIEDFPPADVGKPPTKLITFQSAIGPVTVIATTGSEARFRGQLQKARQLRPELFNGADAMYATTTAHYTWVEQPGLQEAAARVGLSETDVQIFGFSAHAAGIERNLGQLVGELTNYLKAVYGLATRTLDASERTAHYGAAQTPMALGEIIMRAVARNPWHHFKGRWSAIWRRLLS